MVYRFLDLTFFVNCAWLNLVKNLRIGTTKNYKRKTKNMF